MAAADDVKDLLDGRREFTMDDAEGNTLTFFIGTPAGVDIRKADWEYSKVYNQAIVDGFLTQAQMTEVLKEKGILDDNYNQQVEDIRIALGAELFRLENLMNEASDEEREQVALEVGRLRDELFILNQRVNGPMANTCENLAEDARTDFLTSRIVQNKDGTPLWPVYEDYRNEDNTALSVRARFEVMLWMQGLESNFLENTPEQRTLRDIAVKRQDEQIDEKEIEEVLSEDISAQEEILQLPEEEVKVEEPKRRGRPPKKAAAKKKASRKKKATAKKPKKDIDE